jgi:hypothetical protein
MKQVLKEGKNKNRKKEVDRETKRRTKEDGHSHPSSAEVKLSLCLVKHRNNFICKRTFIVTVFYQFSHALYTENIVCCWKSSFRTGVRTWRRKSPDNNVSVSGGIILKWAGRYRVKLVLSYSVFVLTHHVNSGKSAGKVNTIHFLIWL